MDTDLAGRVAHSVKNSLAALTGTLEMLLEERPEEPRLERAVRLAKRVGQVVDRTLRLHRLGELDPEQAAPAAILREVTRELSPRAGSGGIDVRVEIANELPRICVDRPLLVAALSALAENSLEAMASGGGELRLSAAENPAGDRVWFRICDTGPGIPEAVREQRGLSTKARGAGLGLALAQTIVEAHGGQLVLERPEVGASIRVELPPHGVTSARPQGPTPRSSASLP